MRNQASLARLQNKQIPIFEAVRRRRVGATRWHAARRCIPPPPSILRRSLAGQRACGKGLLLLYCWRRLDRAACQSLLAANVLGARCWVLTEVQANHGECPVSCSCSWFLSRQTTVGEKLGGKGRSCCHRLILCLSSLSLWREWRGCHHPPLPEVVSPVVLFVLVVPSHAFVVVCLASGGHQVLSWCWHCNIPKLINRN